MGRPLSIDPIRVGRAVAAARDKDVPWKLIERRYNLCRARLWQVMRQAQAFDENVYKHPNNGEAAKS